MKIWIRMMFVGMLSLGFVVTESILVDATAYAGKKERKAKKKENREDKRERVAKRAMKKTTKLLQRSRKLFAKGNEGKAILYRGVVHQRAARYAFRKAHYNQALHLTLVARLKARKVIQANKGELKGDDTLDDADETSGADAAGSGEYLQVVEKESVSQDTLIEMVLKPIIEK